MKLWPCGFKFEYTHLGFALAGAVWLGLWNSDHLVLKLNIRTSASPRRQQSHWGLRVIQNAYFSLLTHTKQLLLVTLCDTTAENEASFWTHERTNGMTNGWTDRRGSWNSYLDEAYLTENSKVCLIINSKVCLPFRGSKTFSPSIQDVGGPLLNILIEIESPVAHWPYLLYNVV